MKTCLALAALAAFVLAGAALSEDSSRKFTPQSVVIDRFQARDATVNDVLEALALLAEKATNHEYHPSFVMIDGKLGQKTVTLNLNKSSLSDALARISESAGLRVTYGKTAIILNPKGS